MKGELTLEFSLESDLPFLCLALSGQRLSFPSLFCFVTTGMFIYKSAFLKGEVSLSFSMMNNFTFLELALVYRVSIVNAY